MEGRRLGQPLSARRRTRWSARRPSGWESPPSSRPAYTVTRPEPVGNVFRRRSRREEGSVKLGDGCFASPDAGVTSNIASRTTATSAAGPRAGVAASIPIAGFCAGIAPGFVSGAAAVSAVTCVAASFDPNAAPISPVAAATPAAAAAATRTAVSASAATFFACGKAGISAFSGLAAPRSGGLRHRNRQPTKHGHRRNPGSPETGSSFGPSTCSRRACERRESIQRHGRIPVSFFLPRGSFFWLCKKKKGKNHCYYYVCCLWIGGKKDQG